jgi:hypothetical protein
MMREHHRAIEFADKSLLCCDFVGQFVYDITIQTMRRVLRLTNSLQSNKPFMLQMLARWPILFLHAASVLQRDLDVVSTTIKAAASKRWWAEIQSKHTCFKTAQQQQQQHLEALVCRGHKIESELRYKAYKHYIHSHHDSDCNQKNCIHNFKDVTGEELYLPHVHLHEIVLCTSQRRCCSICEKHVEHEQHYRCAAWCDWDGCVDCVQLCMCSA